MEEKTKSMILSIFIAINLIVTSIMGISYINFKKEVESFQQEIMLTEDIASSLISFYEMINGNINFNEMFQSWKEIQIK